MCKLTFYFKHQNRTVLLIVFGATRKKFEIVERNPVSRPNALKCVDSGYPSLGGTPFRR